MTKSLKFKGFMLQSSLCCGYVMAKPKTLPCQNATSCINANSCINAMKYWVKDISVDGFRADIAGFVPLDFGSHYALSWMR
jgi:hypothetical protein